MSPIAHRPGRRRQGVDVPSSARAGAQHSQSFPHRASLHPTHVDRRPIRSGAGAFHRVVSRVGPLPLV